MDCKIINATCPDCRETFLTSIAPDWTPPADKIDANQANVLCASCEGKFINDLHSSFDGTSRFLRGDPPHPLSGPIAEWDGVNNG